MKLSIYCHLGTTKARVRKLAVAGTAQFGPFVRVHTLRRQSAGSLDEPGHVAAASPPRMSGPAKVWRAALVSRPFESAVEQKGDGGDWATDLAGRPNDEAASPRGPRG